MGNVCQAMNIVTGEKRALLVDPKLIDDQDMVGLQEILKDKVRLSPQGSSIYIQISEKMLRDKAKSV